MDRTGHSLLSRRHFLRSVGVGAVVAGATARASLSAHLARASMGADNRVGQAGGMPAPQWDTVYRAALGTSAMGYAYAGAQNGNPIAGAGVNLSRSKTEAQNQSQPWTPNTLFNLASLSKVITAVAFMELVQQQGSEILDTPFWSVLTGSGRFSGTPGNGVDTVTIRQLLTHYSGLVEDLSVYTNNRTIDQFLNDYLQQPLASQPDSTFVYSNTNFTIVQALYEILSGAAPDSYVQLVKDTVLTPMGIDPAREITDVPDPINEGVSYSGAADTRAGRVWPRIPCMAAAGWLGTANGVLKFLTGIRANAVLDAPTTQMMFTQQLGWFAETSPYGPYYHKLGRLRIGNPEQHARSGVVVFPAGYDAVLFINSPATSPLTATGALMAKAFGLGPPAREE